VIEKYRLFEHVSIDTERFGWFPPVPNARPKPLFRRSYSGARL
jgi:hypothetical protein